MGFIMVKLSILAIEWAEVSEHQPLGGNYQQRINYKINMGSLIDHQKITVCARRRFFILHKLFHRICHVHVLQGPFYQMRKILQIIMAQFFRQMAAAAKWLHFAHGCCILYCHQLKLHYCKLIDEFKKLSLKWDLSPNSCVLNYQATC